MANKKFKKFVVELTETRITTEHKIIEAEDEDEAREKANDLHGMRFVDGDGHSIIVEAGEVEEE